MDQASIRAHRAGRGRGPGKSPAHGLAQRRANPGRSTLTVALVAAACFLIVAVSAFRLDLTRQIPALASGNGGFSLAAETDQPIYQNLDTAQGRAELGFSADDEKQFAGVRVFALRVKSGDDASCLNLYRPAPAALAGPCRNNISTAAVLPGPTFRKRGLAPSSMKFS